MNILMKNKSRPFKHVALLFQIADADLRVSDINTAYIGRVL